MKPILLSDPVAQAALSDLDYVFAALKADRPQPVSAERLIELRAWMGGLIGISSEWVSLDPRPYRACDTSGSSLGLVFDDRYLPVAVGTATSSFLVFVPTRDEVFCLGILTGQKYDNGYGIAAMIDVVPVSEAALGLLLGRVSALSDHWRQGGDLGHVAISLHGDTALFLDACSKQRPLSDRLDERRAEFSTLASDGEPRVTDYHGLERRQVELFNNWEAAGVGLVARSNAFRRTMVLEATDPQGGSRDLYRVQLFDEPSRLFLTELSE